MADLPNNEELLRLPRWARVAFAARCARRIQPLFKATWLDAPEKHCDAVDNAITICELSAATANKIAFDKVRAASLRLSGVADYAAKVVPTSATSAAAHVADTAANALDSVYTMFRTTTVENDTGIEVKFVVLTIRSANVAISAFIHDNVVGKTAIRFDYGLLLEAVSKENWDDDTPVPPQFFGPFWPDGTPEGWPVVTESSKGNPQTVDTPKEVVNAAESLDLYFDLSEFSDADIAEIVTKLSQLYKGVGGDRLIVENISVLDPILKPAGVM